MKHMMNCRLVFALAFAAALSGCATGPWDNHEAIRLSTADAQMVAGDVVEVLVSEYAPGQTTFALADGKPGNFGMALESQLRETGYAITTSGEQKPIHALALAYVLDELGQPGTYRVGVRVEPTYRMDSLYSIDSTGALVRGGGATVRDGSGHTIAYPAPTASQGPIEAALMQPASLVPVNAKKVSLSDYGSVDIDKAWTVQVMAGANLDDLERNQARLERLGREAHIVKLGTLGRLQALRVGPFDSAGAARPALLELRADRYVDAFLVEPKGGSQ